MGYARAEVAPERIEIRREGDSCVVLVPPPPVWQSVLYTLIWGIGVSLALAAGSVLIVAIATDAIRGGFEAAAPWMAFLGLMAGTLLTSIRLVQAASRTSLPGLIRVAHGELDVRSPSAFSIRSRKWVASSVQDLSIRETGLMPVLVRYVRRQVVQTDERVEEVRLPWNGKGALMIAENGLRQALGLRPPSALPA